MSRFKTAPVTAFERQWVERRRKGNKVRYQDTVTGKWSGWRRIAVEAASEPPVASQPAVPDMAAYYARQTVAELRALAESLGVKVVSKARKADIIAALTA